MPVQPGRTSYRKPTAPPRRPGRAGQPVVAEQPPPVAATTVDPVDPDRPEAAGQD